jgi:hypothetical protein
VAFDESLFGSNLADSLAAIGFLLLFLTCTFNSFRWKAVSIAVFGFGAAASIGGYEEMTIAALGTVPLLAAIMVGGTVLKKREEKKMSWPILVTKVEGVRVAVAFLAIVIAVEIGALARWVSYSVFPTEIYGDASWSIAQLESALFHSFGILSPVLVALIAFAFLYKWYFRDIVGSRIGSMFRNDSQSPSPSPTNNQDTYSSKNTRRSIDGGKMNEQTIDHGEHPPLVATQLPKQTTSSRNLHSIILTIALISAPLVAIYPHLATVNPTGTGVSVDEMYYMKWLSDIKANANGEWIGLLTGAFTIVNGDRPFTLLLIMGIANLISVPELDVIRYLPVALAPMLAIASYSLVRYAGVLRNSKNLKLYASLAALFAAFSPQVVVGEYAGLLANWLALVPALFSILFLIRVWDSRDNRETAINLASFFAIFTLIIFIHLYTWLHLVAIVLLFTVLSFLFSRKSVLVPKTKLALLLVLVMVGITVEFSKAAYFSVPAVTASDSVVTNNVLESTDSRPMWDRLAFTLTAYVGGFLSNPVLLILSLVWVIKADFSKSLDRAIMCMFFLMSIPILIGSVEFQTRILYNTPMYVAAVLALSRHSGAANRNLHSLLVIGIVLALATYTLRAMANLYLVLPENYTLDAPFLLP